MNRDFLRQVLKGDKDLLPMSDIKPINIPKFDELSVRNIFPKFKDDAAVMKYLQDKYPNERFPDRGYFFTVLNTVRPEYVRQIVEHANKVRNSANDEEEKQKVVEIRPDWWDKLNKMPYFSRKYTSLLNPRRY